MISYKQRRLIAFLGIVGSTLLLIACLVVLDEKSEKEVEKEGTVEQRTSLGFVIGPSTVSTRSVYTERNDTISHPKPNESID